MKQLFTSATLRLTGWYLMLLACISLLFSIIVYQVSTGEVERRLSRYQDRSQVLIQTTPAIQPFDSLRSVELKESKGVIIGILIYVNLTVLSAGGALSYLLARRTLRPIEAAHEAQVRFVSDASHELRTPLATMTTELEVALHDPSLKKQEMRDILTSNLEEVQRLSKLSGILLALSSGDRQKITQQPFALNDSIDKVVSRTHQSSERITVQNTHATQQVVGNQLAIEELLIILIENALKYSTKNSLIKIVVSIHDHRMLIQVINDGEGIATEHIPHIFDRFYRIDASRTGNRGYGLGLALARQISDVHNADLSVKSTPNRDTTFSFSLPIFKAGRLRKIV